jgi:hypothetical protein
MAYDQWQRERDHNDQAQELFCFVHSETLIKFGYWLLKSITYVLVLFFSNGKT